MQTGEQAVQIQHMHIHEVLQNTIATKDNTIAKSTSIFFLNVAL